MLPPVETGFAAFLAGLAVSPHCGAMCAPLTCALGPWKGTESQRLGFTTGYHLARIAVYAAGGAISGLLGARFGRLLDANLLAVLPWAMVAFLLLLAFGVDRGFPIPLFLRGLQARWMRFSHRHPPFTSGLALGSLTPLLPCGPLHALLGLALISASPLHGAEIGLGFALGTLPLLWAAQMGYQRLAFSLGSARAIRLRRGLCGLAALIIAAKLLWFPSPSGVCF
jgi:sulfite exporter TauE/SafE